MELGRRDMMELGAGALLAAFSSSASFAQGAKPAAIFDNVDPELRPIAEAMVKADGPSRPWTRAMLNDIRSHMPPPAARRADVPVEQRRVSGRAGQPDVTLWIVNARSGSNRPAILHTHGGGFILGSAQSELAYLQGIAHDLDCVIVSVEYRLAPETTYAGSIEDNYAGLKWLHANADSLGVDRKRIVAMGESAGGGHAALLALAARDRGEVPLAAQILIYPMLDDRTGSGVVPPPWIAAIGWNAGANRFGWQSFLGLTPGGSNVPAAAVPARRRDLSGLPPTFIGVGGIDLFVSEDIDYARRLTEANVPTELIVVPGAFHGFDRAGAETRVAQRFNKAKYNALRRAFGQPVVV
ncbi:alpha/beta hydrolase [Sphingomonas sp. ASY06-1R]|uniref:alpha/beta hydrolase n=1 Tax=Sphingomonas sp. ASY06-1R TaxID=3445771 RepID=UPI003FA2EC09